MRRLRAKLRSKRKQALNPENVHIVEFCGVKYRLSFPKQTRPSRYNSTEIMFLTEPTDNQN